LHDGDNAAEIGLPQSPENVSRFQYSVENGVWPDSAVVRTLDLRLEVAGSTPGLMLSANGLRQVVHKNVPLSPSSIIWYRSRGGDALRLGR